MADTMRWRYGDTNPVTVPVDSTIVIEIGDIVFLNTDDARPAGQDTNSDGTGDLWNISLASTQEAFHDLFLGVAMQRSRSGDTDPVRVASSGVFEFASPSATYELGDFVAPDQTAGNNLENQQVEIVASTLARQAIGRVARRSGSADTKVLVDIQSTVMTGGPQVPA